MGASAARGGGASRTAWLAAAAIVAAAVAALLAMGRSAICRCGTVKLWAGDVRSAENSQQLADWYSASHLIHGLLFYALFALVLRRAPVRWRLVAAVAVEAGWELLENSPLIIDRYRAVTLAFGYAGDSVVNSVSDIAMMALGFTIARVLPAWGSVALGVALELIALAAIRDNLTLNVWMLVAPNAAVLRWQNG